MRLLVWEQPRNIGPQWSLEEHALARVRVCEAEAPGVQGLAVEAERSDVLWSERAI